MHARGARIAGVEVDVLATDHASRALVVVEVKSRRVGRSAAADSARPEENVNRQKLIRLARAAHSLEGGALQMGCSVRVDVLAVRIGPSGAGAIGIEHFPDATG